MKHILFHSVEKLNDFYIHPTAVVLDSFNFFTNDLYRFQKCMPMTDLIVFHIEDSSFNLECLFEYLTNGITVRCKGEQDFNIKPYWVVLTTDKIPTPIPSSLSDRFDVIDCSENRFLEILHTL